MCNIYMSSVLYIDIYLCAYKYVYTHHYVGYLERKCSIQVTSGAALGRILAFNQIK